MCTHQEANRRLLRWVKNTLEHRNRMGELELGYRSALRPRGVTSLSSAEWGRLGGEK
jgi:hypothetical protein